MEPAYAVNNLHAFTQLNNIRTSYVELLTRVNVALRAYVGDAARLGEVRTLAMSLYTSTQQVRIFAPLTRFFFLPPSESPCSPPR